MKEANRETFEHRGTGFDDIAAFEDGFAKKELHQSRWKAFLKKKKALVNVGFEEVIGLIRTFLAPIVQSICGRNEFGGNWNFENKGWDNLISNRRTLKNQ